MVLKCRHKVRQQFSFLWLINMNGFDVRGARNHMTMSICREKTEVPANILVVMQQSQICFHYSQLSKGFHGVQDLFHLMLSKLHESSNSNDKTTQSADSIPQKNATKMQEFALIY